VNAGDPIEYHGATSAAIADPLAPGVWRYTFSGFAQNTTLDGWAVKAVIGTQESTPATGGPFTTAKCDTTKPSVHIASPAANSEVDGNVTVYATATDNIGVNSVELYLDDNFVTGQNTGINNSYALPLATANYPLGSHYVSVRAFDKAGNFESDTISLIFVAPAPPPPPPVGNCAPFGDPKCDFNLTALRQYMSSQASARNFYPGVSDYFFSTVVPCESGYNTNIPNLNATNGVAVGLFQWPDWAPWNGRTDWRNQVVKAFDHALKTGYGYWQESCNPLRFSEQIVAPDGCFYTKNGGVQC
jgi:hypothetical protein